MGDKDNAVDDTLDALTFHMTILEMDPAFKQQFQGAYEQDPLWSRYINAIEDHQELPIEALLLNQFIRHDGLIYHVDREDNRYQLCAPKTLLSDIFKQIHGPLHHGFHRAYGYLRNNFYIRKLEKCLKDFLHHC